MHATLKRRIERLHERLARHAVPGAAHPAGRALGCRQQAAKGGSHRLDLPGPRAKLRERRHRDRRHRSASGRAGTSGRCLQGRTALAMHATLKRRVERLEERSGAGSKPRKVDRIVLTCLDREPSLENADCTRTLCPNGTLIEMVRFDRCRPGSERLSEEALDRFVESFPVRVLV
jgi:hypothetical protein